MTPHLCTADQRMNDFARTHNTPYILNTNSTALSTNLIPVLAVIVCMNNDKTWPRCIYYIPFFRNFPAYRSGCLCHFNSFLLLPLWSNSSITPSYKMCVMHIRFVFLICSLQPAYGTQMLKWKNFCLQCKSKHTVVWSTCCMGGGRGVSLASFILNLGTAWRWVCQLHASVAGTHW